ncbi:MAG TPA: wax ester/triacylglycerol synthase family O-acyltransferase [Nocardioidaceae bacterium]|nr:wax ester/triacylglycerol synthase family O-acyltransferase [Nocardioidaceae bacterium]
MKQLSSLDTQFLHVESATTTGHVGGVILLDPSTAPNGELNLDGLRALYEARLHLAPPLHERLVEVPLGLGNPYWIHDPDFDLEYHLREIALPPPGSPEQLGEQVSRIHARPLDRSRPLWEAYLIHSLEGGLVALYAKVHHAAIDGLSGAAILATILDVTVEPRAVEPPDDDWTARSVPDPVTLAAHGVASSVVRSSRALRTLPRSLPHLADLPGAKNVPGVRRVSDLADSAVSMLSGGVSRRSDGRDLTVPRTPFNGPITAHRRFSYGSVPLDDVKRVKNAFGLTVNDVVMAMTTSALRRWLLDHDALPPIPLVAAVPVSIRGDAASTNGPDGGALGNQISVMLAHLPTQIADPAERLQAVVDAMVEAKAQFDAVPATILSDLSAAIPTALSGLASRSLFRLVTMPGPPFNLFVSNVPGPQLPLYVAGARVRGIHPVSAVTDLTGGLNITLFSYDGALDFGLIACREMVPDVWHLIDYLTEALQELLALAPADPS